MLALGCPRPSPQEPQERGIRDGGPPAAAADDPVVSSFVFMGGCRVEHADLDLETNPSSANVAELRQTLADIASLPSPPDFWFLTGDLVQGLAPPSTLETELAAWARIYRASAVAHRTTLVPVAGNHEKLLMTKHHHVKHEIANPGADTVWTRWVTANGFARRAGNGPTTDPPNLDALQGDPGKLTYSFDDGAAHYVVLDTDAWTSELDEETGSTEIGWVPLHWLKADLAAAEANPAIAGIYVFGHKPLVNPTGRTGSSYAINPTLAPAVTRLLDATSKVKGYFTGHAHRWQAMRLPGARGVPQIIAGNGGSALDDAWPEPEPYFGFTLVRTYASGKLGVTSYRRRAPQPYNAPTTTPAEPAPELVLEP
jgi:hypothetical protein